MTVPNPGPRRWPPDNAYGIRRRVFARVGNEIPVALPPRRSDSAGLSRRVPRRRTSRRSPEVKDLPSDGSRRSLSPHGLLTRHPSRGLPSNASKELIRIVLQCSGTTACRGIHVSTLTRPPRIEFGGLRCFGENVPNPANRSATYAQPFIWGVAVGESEETCDRMRREQPRSTRRRDSRCPERSSHRSTRSRHPSPMCEDARLAAGCALVNPAPRSTGADALSN